MKAAKALLGIVVGLAVALAASGQKPSDVYKGLKYDKATETKIHGVVDDVQNFDCPISKALGNHLILKTKDGSIVVHTAPVKFMREYGLEIDKGDNIEVTGSKQKDSNGQDTVLAREVVKDNVTLRFRDDNGKPVW